MKVLARWCALAGLVAALAFTARAESAPATDLPSCPSGPAPTSAPTSLAGYDSPGACRATGHIQESTVVKTDADFTPSGYHHLGANTAGVWNGVSGRFSVVDGKVRAGTYDFVAGRFMVKRDLGGGNISWLEAGWAETGWSDPAHQHIYTFNTNTKTWQFYDQYSLKPGDKIWMDIHSDAQGEWAAWLWWNNRWNLLTSQKLPIGSSAYVEQYVEVHVDESKPGKVDVPVVKVDNVQLDPPGGGAPRFWGSDVPTLTGTDGNPLQRIGGFCLNWLNLYDTWTAGDCDLSVPMVNPSIKTEDQLPAPVRAQNPPTPPSVPPATTEPPAPALTPTRSTTEPATPATTPPTEQPRPGLLGGLLG